MSKKTKREQPSWAALTQDKRDLYLQLLWDDGFSEQAIADFLSTTKGTIVGRRRRLGVENAGRETVKKEVGLERFFDLLDLHDMARMEKENGGKVACIAPVERPQKREEKPRAKSEPAVVPKAHRPTEKAPERTPATIVPLRKKGPRRLELGSADDVQRTSSNRMRPKVAASEKMQCVYRDEDRLRCGYEWTDTVTRKCDLHK